MVRTFNLIEAALWLGLGAAVFSGAWKSTGAVRRNAWAAAGGLAVFAASDWIEAETGAWWRPWWLLVVKAACVVVLLRCLVRHRRLTRTGR
jgi:hypothetical protein